MVYSSWAVFLTSDDTTVENAAATLELDMLAPGLITVDGTRPKSLWWMGRRPFLYSEQGLTESWT